ncbi:MAG: hypothetical protein KUG79_16650 [Pseudomonadales bacterium]|nr:hypothetical protein [Pseudomonadales bacterium]
MCPDFDRCQRLQQQCLQQQRSVKQPALQNAIRQNGLGLVGAVFVIVVVSVLAVAMSRMVDIDQQTQSYEILSLKAFLAAESGAQLAVNRLLPPAGAGSCADLNFNFVNQALRFCEANVICTPVVVAADTFYTLTSTSECTAGSFVTRRTVQVRLKQ